MTPPPDNADIMKRTCQEEGLASCSTTRIKLPDGSTKCPRCGKVEKIDHADAVAEKIVTDMDCDSCQSTLEMRIEMQKLIAAALRGYGEKIENELSECDKYAKEQYAGYEIKIKEARSAGLEEAAAYVEGRRGIPEHHSDLAAGIRSLMKKND